MLRGHAQCAEAMRGHAQYTEAMRGHTQCAEVLRGRAQCAEVLRGRAQCAEQSEGWTYFLEESNSSTTDTHSTEMSESPSCVEHSYCSISDTPPHYHTLEPGLGGVVTTPLFTVVTGEQSRDGH